MTGEMIAIGAVIIVLLVIVALVMLPLFCIIDAATRQSTDFEAADSNKTLWIVLPFIFGLLAAIVYLVAIRPKVIAVGNHR